MMLRRNAMKVSARASVIVVGLVIAACGQAADESGDEGSPSTTSAPTTTTSESQMSEEVTVRMAISDLAARLHVPEDDIELSEVRAVQWPDGSLGCPEEGKLYTQALVDGTRVLLRFDQRVYDYHAGADGDPFLCPSGEKDGGYEFLPPPGVP